MPPQTGARRASTTVGTVAATRGGGMSQRALFGQSMLIGWKPCRARVERVVDARSLSRRDVASCSLRVYGAQRSRCHRPSRRISCTKACLGFHAPKHVHGAQRSRCHRPSRRISCTTACLRRPAQPLPPPVEVDFMHQSMVRFTAHSACPSAFQVYGAQRMSLGILGLRRRAHVPRHFRFTAHSACPSAF